ncbi:hemagglutinin, partial [Xylella fastidiosa subsp. multiplex]|nr:hemagglutinin [Xylella fastidiosa subsp. multiplex]MRU32491.1 hemagglutinin [Xylella fastidiosa subsp. multiplex]
MTGWAIPWRPLITQVMNRLYIQDSGQTYRNTTYLAYTKPTHQLGELVTAGIEKLL